MVKIKMNDILAEAASLKASDVHLKTPGPPVFRIDGQLKYMENMPDLNAAAIEGLYNEITCDSQRECFENEFELDFAHSVPGLARFRVNVQKQRGSLSIALRIIDFTPPTLEEMELPRSIQRNKRRGKRLMICRTGIRRQRGCKEK